MKMKRLILKADKRGDEIVLYQKILGRKLFFKKPTITDTKAKTKATIFIKNVKLLDLMTKTYQKELVFLRVVCIHKKYVEVEVV